MPDEAAPQPRSTAWQTAVTVLQEATPPAINRDDVKVRFLVTMLCAPGQPMLKLVEDDELVARKDRRGPR